MINSKFGLLNNVNEILRRDDVDTLNNSDLDILVLDVSRVLDKKITKQLFKIKNTLNITLNSVQRHVIRRFLIGYPNNKLQNLNKYRLSASIDEINLAYKYILNSINIRNKQLCGTIASRYKSYFLHMDNNVYKNYLSYIKKLQHDKFQLIYLNVIASDHLKSNDINKFIKHYYKYLSNYHDCIITFKDVGNYHISWTLIAKVAIYMENFLMEYHFHVFQKLNRSNRIKELNKFLKNNNFIKYNRSINNAINDFYKGESYGFQFKDLFISDDGSVKSLIMQKVKLDENSIRCPACFHKNVHGNSYPRVLFKSFECKNPNCPARSKSGRGKRFDLLSAKRQIMLRRNNPNDRINNKLYKNFRRDIVNPGSLNLKSMIKFYTWSGDSILCANGTRMNFYKGRFIRNCKIIKYKESLDLFNRLPIVKLLNKIFKFINFNNKSAKEIKDINKNIMVINDNSMNLSNYVGSLNIPITSAITSPPYYNARKYSQWKNFLCYLIDMMIDASAVYKNIKSHSVYVYNVGDIVDNDYVYVHSHMSTKRLMLGFYSVLIFKIIGFNLEGDIIWDKGETQSKRNSSPNHFAGYLKPINSYEHNLIFCKGSYVYSKHLLNTKVKDISPVKKINSNGINKYGHSAPFPKEIAKLIIPFSRNDGYILDPFLGSGTTCIVAHDNGYKSLGFEMNYKYYHLSLKRIECNLTKCKQISLF